MNAERKFWETVLAAANPSWNVQADPSLLPGTYSQHDVRVYVVDATSGWMSAGCVSTQEMARVATFVSARDEERGRIAAEAPGFIHDRASRKPQPTAAEVEQVISMALCVLTQTQTFSRVQEMQGKLAGHWLYLVYRLRDESIMGRPVFVGAAPTAGFLGTDAINQSVNHVLRADHASNQGVAQMVRQGGGQVLAEAYRQNIAFPGSGV